LTERQFWHDLHATAAAADRDAEQDSAQLVASNHRDVEQTVRANETLTDLVGFLDALSNVVACQGALQGAPPNELGVSGPATELQRHIVHID